MCNCNDGIINEWTDWYGETHITSCLKCDAGLWYVYARSCEFREQDIADYQKYGGTEPQPMPSFDDWKVARNSDPANEPDQEPEPTDEDTQELPVITDADIDAYAALTADYNDAVYDQLTAWM